MPPAYMTPLMAQQNEQLRQFWYQQAQEILQVGTDPAEFKNHQLPLARIKKARGHVRPLSLRAVGCGAGSWLKALLGASIHLLLMSLRLQIMKSDEDVRMISAEAPVLFARVCPTQLPFQVLELRPATGPGAMHYLQAQCTFCRRIRPGAGQGTALSFKRRALWTSGRTQCPFIASGLDVGVWGARERRVSPQACEMFILELTLRSWNHSEENKRRTLQRNDIAAAITRTDIFDFLVRPCSGELQLRRGPALRDGAPRGAAVQALCANGWHVRHPPACAPQRGCLAGYSCRQLPCFQQAACSPSDLAWLRLQLPKVAALHATQQPVTGWTAAQPEKGQKRAVATPAGGYRPPGGARGRADAARADAGGGGAVLHAARDAGARRRAAAARRARRRHDDVLSAAGARSASAQRAEQPCPGCAVVSFKPLYRGFLW